MAALNPTALTSGKHWKKTTTERCLFVVAGVAWFTIFRGLTSIEEMSGDGFVARAGATIIATGMSVGVYLFWTYLYELWPAMKTRGAKLRVAAAAALGLAVIICSSTHLAVTGIAGAEAESMALDDSIAAFEKAAADRANALTALGGYVTSLNAAARKFEDMAQAEWSRGSISAAPGGGAVFEATTRTAGTLIDMRLAVEKHQNEGAAILQSVRQDLQSMREIAGSGASMPERMKRLRTAADEVRPRLAQVSSKPLIASLTQTAAALPHEFDGAAFKLSANADIARNQRAGLERLHTQALATARQLTELGETFSGDVAALPEFRVATPMYAVVVYWRQFTTAYAIAIFLETAGLWPLLILMFSVGERTRADDVSDELSALTLHQLLLSKLGRAMLNGDTLDAKSVKALIASQLPTDNTK